jgi:hypothetical protein
MATVTAGTLGIAGAIGIGWLWFMPAGIPDRLEYLPASIAASAVQLAQALPAQAPDGSMQFDFSDETVGAEPKSFFSVVGFWTIGAEGDNKFRCRRPARTTRTMPASALWKRPDHGLT